MLANVDVRSLAPPQLDEYIDEPKALLLPRKPGRCGIDPARSRERSEEFAFDMLTDGGLASELRLADCLNGLVEGVGPCVLESSDCCTFIPLIVPTGENLEGTVPALALRAGLFSPISDGGIKSGNPSCVGDSGMLSCNGVELPLVGGPQIPGERPS